MTKDDFDKKLVGGAVPKDQRKDLVESHYALDLARLRKIGYDACFWKDIPITLSWGDDPSQPQCSIAAVGRVRVDGSTSLEVCYQLTEHSTGRKHRQHYHISLTWTPCPFGGYRLWFSCPSCQRRCRILYLRQSHNPSDAVFRCRKCLNLTYYSQQTGKINVYRLDQRATVLFGMAERARSPRRAAEYLSRATRYQTKCLQLFDEEKRRIDASYERWKEEIGAIMHKTRILFRSEGQ